MGCGDITKLQPRLTEEECQQFALGQRRGIGHTPDIDLSDLQGTLLLLQDVGALE